jgi:hypothetical protein
LGPVISKISSVQPLLTIILWLLASSLAAADERPCDPGRQAAIQGDAPAAIAHWEKLSEDGTPKEKGALL